MAEFVQLVRYKSIICNAVVERALSYNKINIFTGNYKKILKTFFFNVHANNGS